MFYVGVPDGHRSESQEFLDLIQARCNPEQLRSLAETILHLADALDQDWSSETRSIFNWRNEVREIERNALNLALYAKREQKRRTLRTREIPSEFLGEPAWDMLLELFCQFAGGQKVSVKSLSLVSGTSQTTALRTIDRLTETDLVARSTSPTDGRVVLLSLTRKGIVSVGRVLSQMA